MSIARTHILRLADALSAHQTVSHWAISMRMEGKGDAFARLDKGDMRTTTYERRLAWFAANWPEDLSWPDDVPRPEVTTEGDRP